MGDHAVTAAIEQGRVPDGISADYLNESRDRDTIIAIVVVTVLSSMVLMARCISRAYLLRMFGWDDGLALVSWLIFIPFVGLTIRLIELGSGRHFEYIQYVLDLDTVRETQRLDFYAHILYTTSLVICRTSGLAFYAVICKQHRVYIWAIRIVAALIILAYVPQLLLIIFHCLPVTSLWPYDFQPEFAQFACIEWGTVYGVNSGVSLASDCLLYGIPVAMLWNLALSRRRKMQLACILLPGILVFAISITRLVFVRQGETVADMSWAYNPMLAVEVSEIGATLISLSVPGVKPLVDQCFSRKSHETSYGSHDTSSSSRSRRTALLPPFRSRKKANDSYDLPEHTPASQSNESKVGIFVQTEYGYDEKPPSRWE